MAVAQPSRTLVTAKRVADLILGGLAVLVLLPLLLLIAATVWLVIGPPILFLQLRPGQYGKPFQILKFRTMSDTRDEGGRLLPDEQRLDWFGRFLRGTSVDELPELWNVLLGDMSLVGPRPLLVEYLPRYSPRQARRHEVRPGITGLAQVMGRNALSWEEKFEWDVRYVESRSFWLDLKILGLTLGTVVSRKGVSARGEATMPEFKASGDIRDP